MNKIYVIGIGPGAYDQMTGKAIRAMEESDAIIGYTVYVDLVKDHFPDKEFKTTPMRKEIERCRMCFELAEEGKTVSMICSGDSGVYGMAAPIYELSGTRILHIIREVKREMHWILHYKEEII